MVCEDLYVRERRLSLQSESIGDFYVAGAHEMHPLQLDILSKSQHTYFLITSAQKDGPSMDGKHEPFS
jgi:hypothetical protein